jgi:hypothetical protein
VPSPFCRKIVPIISQVDGTSWCGKIYQQMKLIIVCLAHEEEGCIPADLRLGPRSHSRGGSGQPRTFGVLVWPAVVIDLRQPFFSPGRGVMGSGTILKTGDKDQGSNAVEHSSFSLLTTLGWQRPFGLNLEYLIAFAYPLLNRPLRITRSCSGTIGVKCAVTLARTSRHNSHCHHPIADAS